MSGELPAALAALVERAAAGRGLTRAERADVARELTAHFEAGLAAEIPVDRLAAEFGDAALAAPLIVRAKRRCRPAAVRWLLRTVQVAALVALLLYGVSALRLHAGTPARAPDPARAAFAEILDTSPGTRRDVATVRAAFRDLFPRLYTPDGRHLTSSGLAMIRAFRGKPDAGTVTMVLEPVYFAIPASRGELAAELDAVLGPVAAAEARSGPDSAAAILRAAARERMRSVLWQLRYFPLAALLPEAGDWLATVNTPP